jgi:Tol biopolymer transport system component
MKLGKTLSIAVVSLASLIVIGATAIAISVFAASRSGKQQNFKPSEGQQTVSPIGDAIFYSQTSGNSSFLYRKYPSSGKSERLTPATSGIEAEANFSHNGKLVVYSFADSPDSKSAVWVVGSDGSKPHPITGKDEDALHPVFSPDDSKVFYAASSFTGHHSPIARPARHDWDVFLFLFNRTQ